MKFTEAEKNKLLEYVAINLMNRHNIPLDESRQIVKDSILNEKFNESPAFVAHCSINQLVDLVEKDMHLLCC